MTAGGGVVRWLLRVGLLLDAGALYWLVWTPADAHRCDATTSWIGQVFCLSPWLTWVGNVMLLVPTAVLLVLAFPNVRRRDLAVAMLLLACTIEVVQHWIPGRVPEWRDALANAMGAWIVLRAWRGRRATVSAKAPRSAR